MVRNVCGVTRYEFSKCLFELLISAAVHSSVDPLQSRQLLQRYVAADDMAVRALEQRRVELLAHPAEPARAAGLECATPPERRDAAGIARKPHATAATPLGGGGGRVRGQQYL